MNKGHIQSVRAESVIELHFDDPEKAAAHQFTLYDKYESVELIRSPFFGCGKYAWRVS